MLFDEVEYIELNEEECKPLVERYRKEGKEAGGLKPRFDRRPGGRDFRGGYDRGGYGRHDDRRGGYGGGGGYRSGSAGHDHGDRRGGYGGGGGGYRGGYREGGKPSIRLVNYVQIVQCINIFLFHSTLI